MKKSPLTFREPTLDDAVRVRETLFHVEQSDLAFPNIYLLRHKYGTRIAMHQNCLYRHFSGNGRLQGYAFPVGGTTDVCEALFHVEQHAKEHGNPLLFCLLTEENARSLKEVYGERVSFTDDPGDADYLYRRADLAELSGNVFHKKRNHIARFERLYPGYTFYPLNAENRADALQVARDWVAGQDAGEAHRHELQAIENSLNMARELAIFGAVLYVEQRAVAMSLASYITPEVADIHYEKCTPEFRDAYPIINRAMAQMLTCELINREEDLNIPGLRQAKLSYKPAKILHKLRAVVSPC